MVFIVQDCFAVGRPRACARAIRVIRAIRAWHSGLTRQMCLTIMEYRLVGIVVLARNGLVRRSTSPATRASERAMRSRAVKPRCSKSLSLGFPEVMPKTARHAGCLFQGKTGFCAVRLWLPSSRHPFALCALAGSVCWLCACLRAVTMRHAAALCATAICVPFRFTCAAPAGEGRLRSQNCRSWSLNQLQACKGFGRRRVAMTVSSRSPPLQLVRQKQPRLGRWTSMVCSASLMK